MGNGFTDEDRQTMREAAERAAEAERERRELQTKGVDERMEARDRSVAEFYERDATLRPTPTQRENDLAKIGALDIDDKEPDGSESDAEHQQRAMAGRLPGAGPYDTRALGVGGPNGEPRRRGPGRPRKPQDEQLA